MYDNQFQTPPWICKHMVNLISEIIDLPDTFLEPTKGEGNLVSELNGRYPNSIVYAPNNFFNFDIKVDCIVGNPPFTPMKLGYDILDRCFELSDNIVFLMPWLSLINSSKRTEKYISMGLKKIVHLPRNVFPGSRVQTCILVFKNRYNGKIIFETI